MTLVFDIALVAYLAALIIAAANLFRKSRLLAAIAQTVYMIWRWAEAGRAPFSNMFESLVLFAWAVVAVHLVLRARIGVIPGLGAAAALVAVLALAYASTYASDIQPLMPALQSNWLTFHVLSCFLGYGGFAVSFLASIGYLVASRGGSQTRPELRESLEATTAKTVAFGFLFLTVGIITGSVWANIAWGTYWSWDPKETWSLITWFIYAAFLHCRFMRGWRGERAAWISIVGFASVLFTYVGVNLLMHGLHSYAKP